MRVMVTGAAGFIGSALSEALTARGDDVIGVDDFNDFYDPIIKEANVREIEAAAKGRFRLVRADVVKGEGALEKVFEGGVDAICHLAAWAGVRPSIERPMVYQRNNVEGTMRLLELARLYGVKPFVFASSSSVYGARHDVPFHEDDRVDDPISPYAATKKAGELYGYAYHHLFGIHFTALRFFTVYGPRQRPEMAIHLFVRHIYEGRPIRMHGDGSASRDFTYVEDCIAGVIAALDRTVATPGHRIYNLGNSRTTRLDELIGMIERAMDMRAEVLPLPDQPGDVPITYASIERAEQELGYRPKTTIDEGIPKFVEWFLARRRHGTV
jgi:UDP-glucuronate 4-epimerase